MERSARFIVPEVRSVSNPSHICRAARMTGDLCHLTTKFWAEGPQICNLDLQREVMPHFSFFAVCNYGDCQAKIPFAVGLGKKLRKHFYEKHRLYCKAWKKGDFDSVEDLDNHLHFVHKDGLCYKCHTSFDLASALAMHVRNVLSTSRLFLLFSTLSEQDIMCS